MPPARISDLSLDEIRARLRGDGLYFRAGPYVSRIRSDVRGIPEGMLELYRHYPLESADSIAEYLLEVRYTRLWRRFFRRQIMAELGQPTPMVPMAEAHASLVLEMGLNWSLATRNATHLVFHAGVVEKDGRAVIIPGLSGQGKSTLAAGLALRGWRYFSDEFGLLDLDSLDMVPYPRPVSLKNESIEVIRAFAPDAGVTKPLVDTHKGTVAYVPPQKIWIERMDEVARPGIIVFPHYGPDETPRAERIEAPEAFMMCTASSVNYDRFGKRSFDALGKLIETTPVYAVHYPDLDAGIALIGQLHERAGDE